MLNPQHIWINYPHLPLSAPVKIYYLTQFAYYLHQILILNAEARRKDHWQMMAHHIITNALLLSSYFGGYTRVGCLVLVLMDTCDFWLPVSPCCSSTQKPPIVARTGVVRTPVYQYTER